MAASVGFGARDVLVRAVESALRAPSVHNTQPWRWRIHDNAVRLYADLGRHLVGTDPDRRDLMISCGAALHHLRVALAGHGVASTTQRLPDPEDSTLLALVQAGDGQPDPRDATLAASIGRRHTDRRIFRVDPLRPGQLERLTEAAAGQGAELYPVLGADARDRLAEVLGEAAERQRFVPGYPAELAIWTRRYPGGRDGIPAAALPVHNDAGPDGAGLRRFPSGRLGTGHRELFAETDGATLMVLATPGDTVPDWLRAGEATSAVLLTATRLGLATTPLSQAVEIPHTRRALAEKVLRVPDHPQLLVRVGWAPPGPALPATPRRPLSSVLAPAGTSR
ncbi:Acg family FMN-binding oxidoreductase [Pseudonocardia hispaniensis]|uniref:Acg family FMN-binding oxidoreductase n=1 Tax=Pseudonocardia hispaniensis TaxID=904933 RepID=A0ABW1J2Z5_9PSEU